MNVLIYSKAGCTFCDRAKMLMQEKGIQFNESKIGVNITREEFMETFPGVQTLPHIIVDGSTVGGYQQLVEFFDNKSNQQYLAG